MSESSDNEMNEWELNVLKNGMLGEKKQENIITLKNAQMKESVQNWDDILSYFDNKIERYNQANKNSQQNIESCVNQIKKTQTHLIQSENKLQELTQLSQQQELVKEIIHNVKIPTEKKITELDVLEKKMTVI
ncbi:hypothetical protein EHI8A_017910 [Entamoeba histolytica HM-1:IMSS-B]|uniref:Uncharacterized protein n=6 Tax=Entamoeba histolytica TaxID=5759 RepID=C4LWY6_ENTH1|nr:hypothetical protein EHI_127130 [Entamoeba histolytica HM-1:IMSS]EMD45411.1 Hypothetical protein EHI5A_031430 [Entamoeba histolytica KU27]EMH73074.1 hypothetical protein EHI8A_017910 [Entamoeba histolytica HM-1:IMSS-B]EMS11601.1 hypothetical protein KM1_040010 [Entamoeba histolytica HM-3:IMSS]ENY60064.1 hypothetical protein EHI7A_049160 [Entamoeba histolytica HM-1:IMSS-A]GAT93235.1 hypothetical protein CL6EHI_127130 [Entamoeba histolytica]|eukprot:XP_652181.1 hypothetical protein EHI_127130 [Entamoeba histolytica HM-1:IMSS]